MSRAQERDEPERRDRGRWQELLYGLFDQIKDDLFLIVLATAAAIVRAMGTTIESGWTGLRFTVGRADKELAPGFHPLIPFLMRVRRVPTRSRTLDLPSQRVMTFQGLVYHADANLVYRIVDVRLALIQIDNLEKGMIQMLGLGVQRVLRVMEREELVRGERLNQALATDLAQRLAAWGVEVERAGFTSITPSPMSLRITQLRQVVAQRTVSHRFLAGRGVPFRDALALIGARAVPRPRRSTLLHREHRRTRARRARAALERRGWTGAQIRRAEIRLRMRIASRYRSPRP